MSEERRAEYPHFRYVKHDKCATYLEWGALAACMPSRQVPEFFKAMRVQRFECNSLSSEDDKLSISYSGSPKYLFERGTFGKLFVIGSAARVLQAFQLFHRLQGEYQDLTLGDRLWICGSNWL